MQVPQDELVLEADGIVIEDPSISIRGAVIQDQPRALCYHDWHTIC
jgi:hypothetical protein